MNDIIVVTGAPGNVGTPVVRELVARGAPVRVAAFNLPSAQAALGPAVEIVEFDFLRPETYAAAFAGATKLFLVRPPQLADVPRQIGPAVAAAVQAGVKQIVFLSLQGVEQNRITPHYKIEQLIRSLPVQFTFLRASFFMQNLSTTHRAEIRDRRELDVPVGKARTSFVDTGDIGAVAATVLTQPGHENAVYTLTGSEALTYGEVATVLSRALGQTVRYRNPTVVGFFVRQVRGGRPLGMAAVMAGLYTITRFGNAASVTEDVQQVLGRPPVTLAEFANAQRSVWLASAS